MDKMSETIQKALQGFADVADDVEKHTPEVKDNRLVYTRLPLEFFRAARAALSLLPSAPDEQEWCERGSCLCNGPDRVAKPAPEAPKEEREMRGNYHSVPIGTTSGSVDGAGLPPTTGLPRDLEAAHSVPAPKATCKDNLQVQTLKAKLVDFINSMAESGFVTGEDAQDWKTEACYFADEIKRVGGL